MRALLASCALALVTLGVVLGCGTRGTSSPQPQPSTTSVEPGPAEHGSAPPSVEPARAPEPPVQPAPPEAKASATSPNVILITIDGVRWQDVFTKADDAGKAAELMPRTWELVRRSGLALGNGAGCGIVRPRNTTHISLPGYLEIFTGRRTSCMSNVCAPVKVPTIFDAAASAGISSASIGSWEMLSAAVSRGRTGVFVSAGTRWPGPRPLDDRKLEELVAAGEKAKPYPAPEGTYRPDRFTASIALEYLRARRPRLFHVGLGDTDEYGHRDNRAAYAAALRETDAFVGDLATALEKLDLFERTSVLVTTDHGRANLFREHGPSYPESGRAFVLAFGGKIPKRGEVCAKENIWLTDIAPTIRGLLDLPPDPSREVIGKPIAEIVAP